MSKLKTGDKSLIVVAVIWVVWLIIKFIILK